MIHEILATPIGVCGRHRCFPVVTLVGANMYRANLRTLSTTTSVERVFLAMSLMKIDLPSKMEYEWLNELMICHIIEKQIFRSIGNEKIMQYFEGMNQHPMWHCMRRAMRPLTCSNILALICHYRYSLHR